MGRAKEIANPDKVTEEAQMEAMITKISPEIEAELIKLANSGDKSMVKFLTDQYYQSQAFRITAENQARSLFQQADKAADNEHPEWIKTQLKNASYQEQLNKKYIDIVTDNIPICRWMKSIKGIGPMMSAYLYSRLDISEHRYGGDFASYAGLNDNNIPWIGKDKAKALINNAKKQHQAVMNIISDTIRDIVGEDNFDKISKKIVQAAKKSPNFSLNIDEVEDIINFEMPKIDRTWYPTFLNEYDDDCYLSLYIDSWTQWLVHDDYATNYMYTLCHQLTKRKTSLIKRGTKNGWDNKKKNSKKKYITVSDIESFLAKPPYNIDLKVKMWLIADIFVKNKNRGSKYGEIFDKRLEYEMEKNENGDYADQAAKKLKDYNITDKKTRETLSSGRLTQAHLVARAKRVAVKVFLSHVYEAMYFDAFHEDAPAPYVIAYMDHHDYVKPEVDYHDYL